MSPKTNAHTSEAKQLLTLRDLHQIYSIAPSSAYRYMAAGQAAFGQGGWSKPCSA